MKKSTKTKVKKAIFGRCPVCHRPNTLFHTCSMKFTPTGARRIAHKHGGTW